ncbi:MAG: hypothetical protein ACTSU5_03380 [Promethearchaeota archaeon]
MGNAVLLEIEAPPKLLRYVVPKGSIAVDGTSLTVVDIDSRSSTFNVSLVPHTLRNTIFSRKKVGDSVNLECDVFAKYIEKFLALRSHDEVGGSTPSSRLSEDFLAKRGFS